MGAGQHGSPCYCPNIIELLTSKTDAKVAFQLGVCCVHHFWVWDAAKGITMVIPTAKDPNTAQGETSSVAKEAAGPFRSGTY